MPLMPAIEWATVGAGTTGASAWNFQRWPRMTNGGLAPGNQSIAVGQSADFVRHFSKLRAIQVDSDLWPEGADGPQHQAISSAATVLEELEDKGLVPSRVVATVEGGIAICFVRGDIYADIECFNDGSILGAISNGKDRPLVWEVDPGSGDIAPATDRIKKVLVAPTPETNGPRRQRR